LATDLFELAGKGPVLRVHVQPGADGDAVVGAHGNALKLKVRAPAVGGRANEAVLRLLARSFDVPLTSLSMTVGDRSRDKRVLFSATTAAEMAHVVARWIPQAKG
jgi:hypothetical protein